MAWNHQFVDGSGRVKPCCRFKGVVGTFGEGLATTLASPAMEALRIGMEADRRHPGCQRCWEEEDAGKTSLRQRYNRHPDLGTFPAKPEIQWIELALSNKCNLACRMCDSKYSHLWYEPEIAMYGRAQSETKHVGVDVTAIYPLIPTLRHVKITGGEPFITPENWDLLAEIIRHGKASEIYLNYSTNCTVRLDPEQIAMLSQFRYVEIALSLDSIAENEWGYVRWPSKVGKALRNCLDYRAIGESFRPLMRPTISLYNVMTLPQTIDWFLDHFPGCGVNATHLTYPEHLRVTVLPERFKAVIRAHFATYAYRHEETRRQCGYILNFMGSVDESHLLPALKTYNDALDAMRSQSFDESFPYYSGLMSDVEL
jgi:hypothetical protein